MEKFCTDCKHSKRKNYTNLYTAMGRVNVIPVSNGLVCMHALEQRGTINLTTGKYKDVFPCKDERKPFSAIEWIFGSKRCGKDGFFWEQKDDIRQCKQPGADCSTDDPQ